MYKKSVGNFWTLSVKELGKVTNNRVYIILFGYLAKLENFLNEEFNKYFYKTVKVPEAKFFYGQQFLVNNIHCEFFDSMIINLFKGLSNEEQNDLYEKISKFALKKIQWCGKYESFGEKLVVSMCFFGLFFSSLEIILRKNQDNSILSETIEKIVEDLKLQRDFAHIMICNLKNIPSDDFMYEMINECELIERDFLSNFLKYDTSDYESIINSNIMQLKSKVIFNDIIFFFYSYIVFYFIRLKTLKHHLIRVTL